MNENTTALQQRLAQIDEEKRQIYDQLHQMAEAEWDAFEQKYGEFHYSFSGYQPLVDLFGYKCLSFIRLDRWSSPQDGQAWVGTGSDEFPLRQIVALYDDWLALGVCPHCGEELPTKPKTNADIIDNEQEQTTIEKLRSTLTRIVEAASLPLDQHDSEAILETIRDIATIALEHTNDDNEEPTS